MDYFLLRPSFFPCYSHSRYCSESSSKYLSHFEMTSTKSMSDSLSKAIGSRFTILSILSCSLFFTLSMFLFSFCRFKYCFSISALENVDIGVFLKIFSAFCLCKHLTAYCTDCSCYINLCFNY